MCFDNYQKNILASLWGQIFEKYGELQHFSCGEHFIHSGEIMNKIGWIASGNFKHSQLLHNGNIKIIGFSLTNTILSDYESIMNHKAVSADIIALEDAEVIIAPSASMRELLIEDQTLHIKYIQSLYENVHEKLLNFTVNTPEQRLTRLLLHHPQITDKVPLEEIASYLGVSLRQTQRILKDLNIK